MFISANRVQLRGNADQCMSSNSYSIYWRGFVYLDGVPAGAPSMVKFTDDLSLASIAQQSARLKGVYFVVVHDHRSGDCYAFVDGSGLFHAFYSDRFAGTSFLELVEAEQLCFADVDPEALVEFFHFGNVYSGKTLFSRIRKVSPEHIVRISPNGHSSLLGRAVRDLAAPVVSFEESIKHFAAAASGQRISLDLTGGVDSRLLVVMLHHLGLRFEVAICGFQTDADVLIARQVADALGLELHVTERSMESVDWRGIFAECDGLSDVVRAASQSQMRSERLQRGISLVVSGVGGELLKDFWWLQDLPLYARSKSDVAKLYGFRIAPMALQHSFLSEQYRATSLSYSERTLSKLSEYVVPGNTQTYDQIYYSYKMRECAGRAITNNLHEMVCYAPYLERDVVAFGYQLPRGRRFFNNFHRQTITRLNRNVARIPTTEGGISVSAESSAICRDVARYVSDKLSRLTNKLAQRAFNRAHRQGNFDGADIAAAVREVSLRRRTLDRLQDAGIVDSNLRLDQVNTDYLGRMLSLDMLVEKLESIRPAACSNTAAVEAA
jgi:hypothetical protein